MHVYEKRRSNWVEYGIAALYLTVGPWALVVFASFTESAAARRVFIAGGGGSANNISAAAAAAIVDGAFSTLLRRPGLRASSDGVLATKKRTQNVSEYMLVLALWLVLLL